MLKGTNKSAGQVAKTLLVLAIIVLIALVIAYFVIKGAKPKPPAPPVGPVTPLPVYETTIGNIKFKFLEATDKGNLLKGKESNSEWQLDLSTTERFIEVIVGAQNVGKVNTPQAIWTLGDIVDSEGRSYIDSGDEVRNWLPEQNLCGEILKPSFEPTPCVKIYEVAKVAKGLKIRVAVLKQPYGQERTESILDIKLMP